MMVARHARNIAQLSFAFTQGDAQIPEVPFVAPSLVNPFEGRVRGEVLRVTMTDGRVLVGEYWTLSFMHLLTVPSPGILGEAAERMPPEDVVSVVVLKDHAQVEEERFERSHGERVPGREPVTRDDFRYRLEVLARAVVQCDDFWHRYQLENQFGDCADRVELAKSKRAWMLRAAKWRLTHNAPPEMADLWHADVASPSLLQKPRDQDFDPDPAERKRRVPYPADVAADPVSVPNVLKKLKGAGCAAYLNLAAEQFWDKARICINFHDVPGRAKIYLSAKRVDGKTTWRLDFDCGNSMVAYRREDRIKRLAQFGVILAIVGAGLSKDKGDRW